MAEASKNSNKPVTTANFLQQLSEGKLSIDDIANRHGDGKEPEDKIIIPTQCKRTDIIELEKLTEPLTPSPGKSSASNMENLSDSDLQTLLQNFKDLSTDEQHNLINYLKKLEAHEPERVERLRKFVNLDTSLKMKEEEEGENSTDSKPKSGRDSPFSNRQGGVNPTVEDTVKVESDEEEVDKEEPKKPELKVKTLDSEEEDYTFEDVVKAVSKNVKDKEMEVNMKLVKDSMKFETTNKAKADTDLKDAKDLISSLMSSFSKSSSNAVDLLGLGTSTSMAQSSVPTSASSILNAPDFAKTLSSINMANLASIVSNVKKMGPADAKEKSLNFEPPSPVRTNKLNIDPSQLNRPQSPTRPMDPMGMLRGLGPERNDHYGNVGPLRDAGPGFMRDIGPGSMRDMGPLRDVGPRGMRDVGPGGMRDMGPGGMRDMGPGGMRDMGPGGTRDIGPGGMRDVGPGGMRDVGPGGTRDIGPGGMRDVGPGGMRDVGPGGMRDVGPGGMRDMGGPRDRNFVQYPRNPLPYGSNYGGNYPQQQQYGGGMVPRPGFDPRRMDNPRFAGNMGGQFSGRPGAGGYNNRW